MIVCTLLLQSEFIIRLFDGFAEGEKSLISGRALRKNEGALSFLFLSSSSSSSSLIHSLPCPLSILSPPSLFVGG